jgi:hypothetical protein
LWGELDSLRNSKRFRSRDDLGKTSVPRSPAQRLLGCNANGQSFATLGSSTLNDKATVLGGHPYQKPVGTLAGGVAGLKCSFHIVTPLKYLSGNELLTISP